MSLFTDLFSSQPAEDAAKAKIAGINAGMTTANTALDTGLNQASPLYNQSYNDFTTLAGKFGRGQDLYNDATGANGADGVTRAAAIFKSLPGYSGGLNTGTDQLMRRAAARGDLAGGNTSADIIKFASDYDANKYGNFLSALAPNLAGATSALSGAAGVNNAHAAADLGIASNKANIGYTGNAAIGNANADAEMAKYGASKNFWGALMGAASIAAAPFTGGASLAGLGLGKSFMGGGSPSGYGS